MSDTPAKPFCLLMRGRMFCVHSLRSSSVLAGSPFMRITRPCMLGTSSKANTISRSSRVDPTTLRLQNARGSASAVCLLLVQPEVLETFREGEVLTLRHLGGPFADCLLELRPFTNLALVLA